MNSKSILFALLFLIFQAIDASAAGYYIKEASYSIYNRETNQIFYYKADGELINVVPYKKQPEFLDPKAPPPQPISCRWKPFEDNTTIGVASSILQFLDQHNNVIVYFFYDPKSRYVSKNKILQICNPNTSALLLTDEQDKISLKTLAKWLKLDLSQLDEEEFINTTEEWRKNYFALEAARK